jgi:hypothetical protein
VRLAVLGSVMVTSGLLSVVRPPDFDLARRTV